MGASGVVCHVPLPNLFSHQVRTYRIGTTAIDCDDDRAAIERAEAIKNGSDLEVWEGKRRVAVLKGDPHQQTSG